MCGIFGLGVSVNIAELGAIFERTKNKRKLSKKREESEEKIPQVAGGGGVQVGALGGQGCAKRARSGRMTSARKSILVVCSLGNVPRFCITWYIICGQQFSQPSLRRWSAVVIFECIT